jgi:hypothetical protein
MYKYINLNDTVYLHFPVNNSDGSGSSGSVPSVKVRRSGDSANAAPTFTATPYLLTNVSYPQGCYEVSIPATSGNGFTDANEYNAFATISISSQNPTGYIGGFKLAPVLSSASVSQSNITSGVMNALNTVISASSPSGSINYKMYNLASEGDIISELLNTVLTSYNTVNTVGKSLNNISSGTLTASNAPTVTQIRQEMDSNSTQLAALTARITALRAGYLDNLSSGVVSQNSDVKDLLGRLTLLRAGYIDNLSAGAVALNTDMQTVLNRLTATRAGYLDNLSSGLVATRTDSLLQQANQNTLLTRLSVLRSGYLDNLSSGAVALASETATLLSRLSASRAGYLDNLSSGLVATQLQVNTVNNIVNAIKTITDQINFTGTYVNSQVKAQDNIDFGALQKTSLNNSSPSGITNISNKIIGTIAAGTHNAQSGDSFSRIGINGSGLINLGDTRLNNLDTSISSRLPTIGYTAPDNTNITNIYNVVNNASYGNPSLLTKLNSVSGIVDAIQGVTTKLNTMMELDGAVYRLTVNALESSPVGSSGTISFTSSDRTNLDAVKIVTDILNSMIENSSGQRFKTKALEQAPTTSGTVAVDTSTLATASGLIAVSNKVDTVITTTNTISQTTSLRII